MSEELEDLLPPDATKREREAVAIAMVLAGQIVDFVIKDQNVQSASLMLCALRICMFIGEEILDNKKDWSDLRKPVAQMALDDYRRSEAEAERG